jgi:hypothetical protein
MENTVRLFHLLVPIVLLSSLSTVPVTAEDESTPPPLFIQESPGPESTPILVSQSTTYTNPRYGWQISWDSAWTIEEYDQTSIVLTRGEITLGITNFFEADIIPDASDTVETTADGIDLIENQPEANPVLGLNGEPLRFESESRSFSVVEILSSSDSDVENEIAYVEFRQLPVQDDFLYILVTVPNRDIFNEYSETIQTMLNAITIPES